MGMMTLAILIILAGMTIYGVMIYNDLVNLKHNITEAWSNIDVLLKQRHDELPKLVDVCRAHQEFEQETLDRVMQGRAAVSKARSAGDMQQLGVAEGMLHAGIGRLFAVAEAYPDLKASASFRHLQARVTDLEQTIADRREFYNESVNLHNVRIDQFPDLLVAGLFRFTPARILKFVSAEKADVSISKLFKAP